MNVILLQNCQGGGYHGSKCRVNSKGSAQGNSSARGFVALFLRTKMKNKTVTVVSYTDFVIAIARGKFPGTLSVLIEAVLKIVSFWKGANGVGVNAADQHCSNVRQC